MFRAILVAMLCVATPSLSQVVIPENGAQIAEPEAGFTLYQEEDDVVSRLWLHDTIERFSIILINSQDPGNNYTGMAWEERAFDPIVSQDADITSYTQGSGWMLAEGEMGGNGFYQRSTFKNGCPVIATLIVTYPREKQDIALTEFTRLADSLTIAPSPICP